VLAAQLERKMVREQIREQDLQDKQRVEMEKNRPAYEKAWGEVSNLLPLRWTVSQLRALIGYKKTKDDKWPQLKTMAQMLQVAQPTGSDENEASAALIAPIGVEEDADVIEEVMVSGNKKERKVQQRLNIKNSPLNKMCFIII
jgi:hypothetical protein